MNNIYIPFLKQLLCARNQFSAATLMLEKITALYDKEEIIVTPSFIIAKGNIPIGLVAHLDTVFPTPPELILHDEQQELMWSPQGLGADDRAGCYAIVDIITRGYKPTVILTMDEESGCKGSFKLTEQHRKMPTDLHFLIQLDRQGDKEAVYYGCENVEFQNFITNFGFKTDKGTYSDISILCPRWGIAGVNLSVGYYNEHSYMEMLSLDSLQFTIDKVCEILESNTVSYKYISIRL